MLLNFGFFYLITENDNRSPDENAKVCQICKGRETVGHLEKKKKIEDKNKTIGTF